MNELKQKVKTPGGKPIDEVDDIRWLSQQVQRLGRRIQSANNEMHRILADSPTHNGRHRVAELQKIKEMLEHKQLIYAERLTVLGALGPSNDMIQRMRNKVRNAREAAKHAVARGDMDQARSATLMEQRARQALEVMGLEP